MKSDKQRPSMLQHFLTLDNFTAEEKGEDEGPSYFKVQYKEGEIIIPVVNATALVPLPNTIGFEHIKNGKVLSRSK